MIWSIVSLAGHRLRGRAASTLILVAAVAAATTVSGVIGALGTAAADQSIQDSLAGLDPADRSLQVTGYEFSGDNAGELDDSAIAAFGPVAGIAAAPERGLIFRRVRDGAVPYDLQLLAVDGPGRWLELADGRAPSPCDGTTCEAVLVSKAAAPGDLPATLHIGGLEVRVVGRARLASSIPLGHLDERGAIQAGIDTDHPTTAAEAPPALLLVDGVRAAAAAGGVTAIGRTYLWTAPLHAELIHPWSLDRLTRPLAEARRILADRGPTLTMAAPTQVIDDQLARASVNGGRLLLVGALGVSILIAFAAYAALLGRRDLALELERVAAAGGNRRARLLLAVLEIAVPTVAGGFLGWLVGALLTAVVAPLPDAGPGATIARLGLDPRAALFAGAVTLSAVAAVALGLVGTTRREALAGLVPGFVLVGALVAWRLAAGLDPSAVGGSTDVPILALLPASVGLAIAALALLVVPRLLRRLAAASGRAALPIRLALLSVARDPARPAATLTLLAFGLGGLVFAVTEAATLNRGIADSSAFQAGMDLRVSEAGTDLTLSATVVPFDRYRGLGPGVEAWPVAHLEAVAAGDRPLSVLALPPDAIPKLRGWRSDASPTDPAAMAAAIEVPGSFDVPGHQLPAGKPDLSIAVLHEGDPVDLAAVVRTAAGDAVRIGLGTAKFDRTVFDVPLPAAAVGGRVVAILVAEGRLIAGQDHPAKLGSATLAFEDLGGLVDQRPIEVRTSGVEEAVIRAPLATDGLVLPAIVSPDLARLAAGAADGTLPVTFAGRALTRIRVAGVASWFPTVVYAERSFAVVDLDPFLVALDGTAPGAGHPDEAWLRVADPAGAASAVAALQQPPFRDVAVIDRSALAARATGDPFSISILAAFTAAALAGLLLAALGLVLGASSDLHDETGELRDLEAQGLGPAALRRHVAARTALLAFGGLAAGVMVGVALAAIVTGRIAVTADAAAPIPPLILVVPWIQVALAVGIPVLLAGGLAWLVARRAFRGSARSGGRRRVPTPAPASGPR
ncbi:MAG: FtsX-like permease family protein [Chloroflexota bacterium]